METVFNVAALLYFVVAISFLAFEVIIQEKHVPSNNVIAFVRKIEIPLISIFSVCFVVAMFLLVAQA